MIIGNYINFGERERMTVVGKKDDFLESNNSRLQDIVKTLHDDISHQLLAVLWKLDSMKLKENNIIHRRELAMLECQLREVINCLSEIIHDVYPTILNELGLIGAIEKWSIEHLQSENIKYNFSYSSYHSRLSNFTNKQIFRIMQEAINNILLHASATEVSLEISNLHNNLVFKLIDNGRGFHLNRQYFGHGLMIMEKRAKLIQAQLEIISAHKGGTMLKLLVPISGDLK